MTSTPDVTFAYAAQTLDGQPITGTIDAASLDDASRRLTALRLRIMRLDPAPRPPRAKPLSGDDFAAFNQQLAYLSTAGLPVERGLRLIAEDLQHGGLAQSVRDVSNELERGVPLGEAFKLHQDQFPPLYGTLVEAGVRSGNLPAVLLNLGKHLEIVARLRASIWRAAAYPLAVLAGLLVVLIFIGSYILPQFVDIYRGWHTQLPGITVLLFATVRWMPLLITVAAFLLIAGLVAWAFLRSTRYGAAAADLMMPVPLVGPILKRNLVARWCHAMKICIDAGMDLPGAVRLASDIVGSPALARDANALIAQINAGQGVDKPGRRLAVLPSPVLAVIQLSIERNDLAESLENLAAMYHQQTEIRLASIQPVLGPALILFIGIVIGLVVLAMFAPMISLIQSLSGPF